MLCQPPRVSIGLPVYNGAKYISEAIESILNQTYTDFELIICDNASTDETSEICQQYALSDNRVRYYRNPTNLGAIQNSNLVFELSRGEYFKWSAHDDMIAPTYLARCVEIMDTDPSVVLCHSQTVLIDAEGKEFAFDPVENCYVDGFGNLYRPDTHREVENWYPHETYAEVLMQTRWCWKIFGLMRTEELRNTWLLELFYGTDKVLLAEMSLKGRFVEIPEPLFFNRRHSQQSFSLSSVREREIYINPAAAKKKFILPRFACVWGYTRALLVADLNLGDRIRCLLVLCYWLISVENWQRFFIDLYQHQLRKIYYRWFYTPQITGKPIPASKSISPH
ncbi:MAG: glycosyltransferase [Nostocaceae cyanobacterium]|nr:glycosyltransferase [Nostocaceae cyanobacterium]